MKVLDRPRNGAAWPLAAAIALCVAAAPAGAHGSHRHHRHHRHARDARSLHASDMAHLRYTGAIGERVAERGRATGTLPGSMRVKMVFASTFTGTFIIHTRHGTIHGHGRAKPHGGGVKESFAGALTVTGGSGRYRHAHGIARLRGTFDRDTYALTIRTEGTLRF